VVCQDIGNTSGSEYRSCSDISLRISPITDYRLLINRLLITANRLLLTDSRGRLLDPVLERLNFLSCSND
jgi:hypothetical protein